jgi:hypothetical protein
MRKLRALRQETSLVHMIVVLAAGRDESLWLN